MTNNQPSNGEDNYPTYEQIGGGKIWDEMTELEKVYYDLSKAKNVIAVQKNTIKRLRDKITNPPGNIKQ